MVFETGSIVKLKAGHRIDVLFLMKPNLLISAIRGQQEFLK